jgi:hypothetical protein
MLGWMASQQGDSNRKPGSSDSTRTKTEVESKRERTRSPSPSSVEASGLAPLRQSTTAKEDDQTPALQTIASPPPVTPAKSIRRPTPEVSPPPAPMLIDGPNDQTTPLPGKAVAPIFSPHSKSITLAKPICRPEDVGSDPITFEGQSINGYAKYQEHPDAKRLVKDNEWRLANTAANGEGFIEGYYQNSR